MDLASLLGCAVPTGAGLVLNTMKPIQGQSIAVFGVGGIGMSAVIAAAACGCSPIIAVDIDEKKLTLAKRLGSTHGLNALNDNPVKGIFAITDGKGVDFSTDAAGRTSTIEQAFESVRKGGGLCLFASHPPAGETIKLDPHSLISGKRIEGSWGGATDPDRDFPRYAQMYRDGKLPLESLVTHRFSLDDINLALGVLASGEAGRIVIEIDPSLG